MRRRARDGFVLLASFSLWNGDGMRDLLSWWGFGAVSLLLLAAGVVLLVRDRGRLIPLVRSTRVLPLAAFVAVCLVSLLWSAYPVETVLGVVIQLATATVGIAVALALPGRRVALLFAVMLHADLVLSLVFEAAVALSPAHALLPFWTDYGANVPGAYYWSSGLLFSGGRIQGFTANANLLCFQALLAAITVCCLARARMVGRRTLVAALVLDGLVLLLTRSATVAIATGVTIAATLLVLGLRRFGGVGRVGVVLGGLATLALLAAGSSRLAEPFLHLLGKGDDFTGRLEIWRLVGNLVKDRPILGWGWISYWAPWIQPFNTLVIRDGVQYLQAHNAFLDVQMQLGIPGLLALAALIGSTVYRAIVVALSRRPLGLLPLLLLTALLTQGFAESRLLIEGNWALLAALALTLPPTPWARPSRSAPTPVPATVQPLDRGTPAAEAAH